MIFITVGTQPQPFRRLFEFVCNAAAKGLFSEPVLIQSGNNKPSFDSFEFITVKNFFSPQEMEKLIQEASYVITHGGVGSIVSALRLGKKVIAVPRLKKYNEHLNDHQLQILQRFRKDGYLLVASDNESFEQSIKQIGDFVPKKYESSHEKAINRIKSAIDEYMNPTNKTSETSVSVSK